jgi:hypothetical protein
MLNPEIAAKMAYVEKKLSIHSDMSPAIFRDICQHIAAQAARIESLRTALRQAIVNMGGVAAADVSDEFLCHAADEAKAMASELDRLKRELEGANNTAKRRLAKLEESYGELAASQAQNAGLRAALERCLPIIKSAARESREGHRETSKPFPLDVEFFDLPTSDAKLAIAIKGEIEAALAATPAASLAMVKAGALREFADEIFRELDKNGNPAMMAFEVSLRERADQIESAAKGEKDA